MEAVSINNLAAEARDAVKAFLRENVLDGYEYEAAELAYDIQNNIGVAVNTQSIYDWARHNVPGATVRQRKSAPASELSVAYSDEEVDQFAREQARLKDEIRVLQRRLSAVYHNEDTAAKIRETIFNIAAQSPNPPEWLLEADTGDHNPGVPCTLWSDWHAGEVVRKEEVAGVNEFNSEILLVRVQRLVNKVIDLAKNHMVNPDYPGIVVGLAGDMISGDIHEELQDTNDDYTFRTLLLLQDALTWAFKKLADEFGNVFVACAVGNHGRNSKKPRMKGRAYTSFEWSMYCNLERSFQDDPRVRFSVSSEADVRFKVYSHRFLLTHGDSLGVKGGDGIIGSIGPIMRGSMKVGAAEAQIGRDFDTLLMGHWHQYLTLPGIIVNGTLKGYDEYARLGLRAKYQRPTQALWFVHRKHGITAQWPIYLEGQVVGEDAPWVSWEAREDDKIWTPPS